MKMTLLVAFFLVCCGVGISGTQENEGKSISELLQSFLPPNATSDIPLANMSANELLLSYFPPNANLNETDIPDWIRKLPGYECTQQIPWPGEERFAFPCLPLAKSTTKPTSVHYLRPGDVDVIGALGDSITAGSAAEACLLFQTFYTYRGRSFSSGADGSYATNPSLANILKKYNPNLRGYSQGNDDLTEPGAGFNVAIPGSVAYNVSEEARALIYKMKGDESVNFVKDWKMITLFIGVNDLCNWCDSEGNELPYGTPEAFVDYVEEALKILYDGMPRAFVNIVSVYQLHQVARMTGEICSAFQNAFCPSAMDFPHETIEQTQRYNVALRDMVDREFGGREDFTVVFQPFFENAILPRLPNGGADYSYFSPDCFHFSSKGHGLAGKQLWNNMIQEVGAKTTAWNPDMTDVVCPTEEFPYLRTKQNSKSDFDMTPPGGFGSRTTAPSYVILMTVILLTVYDMCYCRRTV